MGIIRSVRRQQLLQRARDMRREKTKAEARLWQILRADRLNGSDWKRQVPYGPYILDFLCREARLVVEVDGGQHADQEAYDARRTAYLERRGLRVLRFWNSAVLTNSTGVCETILRACGAAGPRLTNGVAQPPLSLPSPSLRATRSGERIPRAESGTMLSARP